jgi:prevent-host-death family protein
MVMRSSIAVVKKPKKKVARLAPGQRRMAAGEFKAKCLGIMDEVQETGIPLVVTKRGKPVIRVVPIRAADNEKKADIFGRLKGIVEIVGDPDDLIKPVFPLEDYDMLK